MADLQEREAKLVQYLTEAYGKEKELETALEAHIPMAGSRPPYQKRLKDHLRETKRHGKEVERRIKKLGGDTNSLTNTVASVGSKVVSGAKGPLHMVRGTGDAEKMLKNVKTEFADEHEEIAQYTAIEQLATAVGDKETAQLAKSIRREEQRMADFLEKQISPLVKAVAKEEIPAKQRSSSGRSSRRSSSSGRRKPAASSTKTRAKASTTRAKSATKSRAKSATSRAKSATKSRAKSTSGRAKSGASRTRSRAKK
jgi:ferritin-like metal-binding protein YciE